VIRKVMILSLLVAGLLAAAPWLTGRMIEQQYHTMIRQAAAESGMQLQSVEYRRGWLGAEASSRIEIPVENGQTETVLIHHHIRHGLLTFDNGMPHLALGLIRHEIELSTQAQAGWQKLFGDKQPLKMRTIVGLDGTQEWRIESEALHYHEGPKDAQILPLMLAMQINADGSEIEGSLEWNGLQAATDKASGDIAPLQWRFDMQRIRPFVWTGDSDWQQQSIHFRNRSGEISISGLKLTTHTTSDSQERLSSEQQLQLAAFDVSGQHYGPGKLNIAIRHIPHSTIENLGHIQQQAAALSAQGDPAMARLAMQQLGMQLLGEIPTLIAADPAIDIHEIRLATPAGAINGNFHFSMTGAASNDVMNLPRLKQHTHMQLDLQIPEALLNQRSRQQLTPLLQQGLVRREGNMLVVHARLENGTLVVNEHPVPLPF